MNLPMVTSYILAGILLFSIVMVNLNLSNSGAELTLTQVTRDHVDMATDILNDDITNMGYDLEQPTDTILTVADTKKIQFYRNLCRDPKRDSATMNCEDPERITWEFLEDMKPTSSKNENHGTLIRIVEEQGVAPDTTKIRAGITGFNVRYYKAHGENLEDSLSTPVQPFDLDQIRQLYIELEMQSNERLSRNRGSEGSYKRSVWEKRFSPRNLEIEL